MKCPICGHDMITMPAKNGNNCFVLLQANKEPRATKIDMTQGITVYPSICVDCGFVALFSRK